MKLRNKKTGEIVPASNIAVGIGKDGKWYDSLAELNEEWEDYEEPKEHYFITEYGEVLSLNEYDGLNNVENPEDYRQIGNYFETKEQAEKAVEKLKAWKRLKDKGFKFIGYDCDSDGGWVITVSENGNWCLFEDKKDLDLLFGGEE